jgi:hypothetical protein
MADEPQPQQDSTAAPDDATAVNQGATGARRNGEHAARASDPSPGESPLSVESESDAFAERPEAFVGAAFAGGLALAMILRRLAR